MQVESSEIIASQELELLPPAPEISKSRALFQDFRYREGEKNDAFLEAAAMPIPKRLPSAYRSLVSVLLYATTNEPGCLTEELLFPCRR